VKTGKRTNAFPRLPANSFRAMDLHFYNQLKEWHRLTSKQDRTKADFTKANTFRFVPAPADKAKGKTYEKGPGYQGTTFDPNHHKKRLVQKYKGNQKYDRGSRRDRRDSPSPSRSASNGRYRSSNRSRSPSPHNHGKSRDRSASPARRKTRRVKCSSSRDNSVSPARKQLQGHSS